MRVLVDTSVWSLVLRRKRPEASPYRDLLTEIIKDGRVAMLGVIRQEILSGIRLVEQFSRLKEQLRAFPDLELETEDYEVAAQFLNTCAGKGITGSTIDFLICASAHRRNYSILTTDPDFDRYQRQIAIDLLKPSGN